MAAHEETDHLSQDFPILQYDCKDLVSSCHQNDEVEAAGALSPLRSSWHSYFRLLQVRDGRD